MKWTQLYSSLNIWGLPWWLSSKEFAFSAGATEDVDSIPISGVSHGEEHGSPLQYYCLENSLTDESCRLQSMGSQRVGHDWNDLARKNWTYFWHCPSLRLEWKHIFQSCGHCWLFQICWHIECSTLTALSFRIWNSSAGISPPPLALFIVMLPKARYFTLQAVRLYVSDHTLWLSGSLRPFLYSSSV